MGERWYAVAFLSLAFTVTGCDSPLFSTSQPTSRSAASNRASIPIPPTSAPKPADTPHSPIDVSAPDTLSLIPVDAMLSAFVRPVPKDLNPDRDFRAPVPDESGPSFAQTLMQVLGQVFDDAVKPQNAIGLRITEAFFKATKYPYAIVLLDAAAKPLERRPDAVRIDRLRLGAAIRTAGKSAEFATILQQTLDRVTNAEFATLSDREAHGVRFKVLQDKRLDADEVLCWGEIGEHFVVAFGEDTFETMAGCAAGKAQSVAKDEWTRSARSARAADTYVELWLGSQRIREYLDPHVSGAASAFFREWDADKMQRGHWAFGLQGKAMFCVAHFQIDGDTVEREYAKPQPADAAIMQTVPADTNYAVYDLSVGPFLYRVFASMVATRDRSTQVEIARNWERMQRENNFSAQTDILDNLGDTLVMHKYPLHPLKIPICVTTLIEIKQNPQQVAKAMNAMTTAWTNLQTENIEKGIVMPATLTQDGDGIWFLNLGLAGPAWIVTDKYIVASWSPFALRQYLNQAEAVVGNIIR